jgi:hypothetical protein
MTQPLAVSLSLVVCSGGKLDASTRGLASAAASGFFIRCSGRVIWIRLNDYYGVSDSGS